MGDVGVNEMNEIEAQFDIEKRIDSSLLGVCLLCSIILAALIAAFIDSGLNHAAMPLALGFVCHTLLRRIRPAFNQAGPKWSRVYSFALNQMDLTKAFRRKK